MKVTKRLYLYNDKYSVKRGDLEDLSVSSDDPDDGGYWITIGTMEVDFDIPDLPTDEDMTNRELKHLREGREETVKEYATKLANIDEQISELLALPCLETE